MTPPSQDEGSSPPPIADRQKGVPSLPGSSPPGVGSYEEPSGSGVPKRQQHGRNQIPSPTIEMMKELGHIAGQEAQLSRPPSSEREGSQRPVDIVFIAVHGIGMDVRELSVLKKEFSHALESICRHWFWEIDLKTHVELIDWKTDILPRQLEAFGSLLPHVDKYKIPLSISEELPHTGIVKDQPSPKSAFLPSLTESLSDPRHILADTMADLLCFMTPQHGDFILNTVANHVNSCVKMLKEDPRFENSKFAFIGHSLGGVILYELLTGAKLRPNDPSRINTKRLSICPDALFCWGAPLGAFLVLQDASLLEPGKTLPLPKRMKVYNIFHPQDPVAFRFEPLLYSNISPMPPPVRLPFWRTNGPSTFTSLNRNFTKARTAIASYVSDMTQSATQKLASVFGDKAPPPQINKSKEKSVRSVVSRSTSESKRITYQSIHAKDRYGKFYRSIELRPRGQNLTPVEHQRSATTADHLVQYFNLNESDIKVLVEKGILSTTEQDNPSSRHGDVDVLSEAEEAGGLELPTRIDFEVQAELTERIIEQWGTLTSHQGYWKSKDVALFMLKEMTNFRPRLAFPDFKAILNIADKKASLENPNSPPSPSSTHQETRSGGLLTPPNNEGRNSKEEVVVLGKHCSTHFNKN